MQNNNKKRRVFIEFRDASSSFAIALSNAYHKSFSRGFCAESDLNALKLPERIRILHIILKTSNRNHQILHGAKAATG